MILTQNLYHWVFCRALYYFLSCITAVTNGCCLLYFSCLRGLKIIGKIQRRVEEEYDERPMISIGDSANVVGDFISGGWTQEVNK